MTKKRYPRFRGARLWPQLAVTLCLSLGACGGVEERDRKDPGGGDAGDGDGDTRDGATPGPDAGSEGDAAADAAAELACDGDPGLDPAQDCRSCLPGYRTLGAGDDDLLAEGAVAPRERPDCVRIDSCDTLTCGEHGSCQASTLGASCVCAEGYAGALCESCAPLYERVGESCVLSDGCAAQRCGGHGQCVVGRTGEVGCQCDEGFDSDEACGGRSVVLAGPEELIKPGSRNPLRVGLRNGEICNGEWEFSVEGGGEVKPGADGQAVYLAPAATGEFGRASVKAVCKTDARLSVQKTWPIAPDLSAASPAVPVHGPCPDALAAEIDPVVLDWMDAHGIAGGTVGVSIFGAPVCLRAYGYASLGEPEDGRRGVERMRTCTPLRLASVTKAFTRSALRAHLYEKALPAAMGGGKLGPTTRVLPVVDAAMRLTNGMPAFVEPTSYYSAGWNAYPDNHCVPGGAAGAAMDPAWGLATFHGMLQHRAGFQPNQTYVMNSDSSCTNAPNGGCKDFATIGDTMVSSGPATRIANDLGLGYGVPRIDDVMAWMGGMCMYDTEANGDYRYSNFGYAVAGRAIELISGKSYEDFVLDFLEADKLIDRKFARAGRPIVYQGQNLAQGPRNFALPSYMRESRYYSLLGEMTDVTSAVSSNGQWAFPKKVPAPYGGANFDLMYAHGGLVANTLGLLNYARVYALSDGSRRLKQLLTVHDDDTRGGQGGLLWGTFTDLHQFDDNQPVTTKGPGCYRRSKTANSLNDLAVDPCPLPHGLSIAMLFNGDIVRSTSPGYIAGRHNANVLKHGMRRALSKYSATVEPWLMSILPPNALAEGCEEKCSPSDPFCIPIDCGDGELDAGEACDDGNNASGDGCESNCTRTVSVPSVPPSYAACEGRRAGECLGGPCGAREEKYVSDSDRLASSSDAHPDGDYSPHSQCYDDYTGGGESAEAVCRREIYGGKAWGVCRECGVDTMLGCLCPAPSAEDGGCNGVAENGLSCVGGRCFKDAPPKWMCNVDCQDIYGSSGYCHHDSLKGAVCYDALCSEEVPTWCDEVQGRVCNSGPNKCANGSCCEAECLVDADCAARGYEGFRCNTMERCVP